jgi:phosphoenolpyruvate-protein kinase (PTS system EI component)
MEDNSIKIGANIGSPIVTGHVQGNVSGNIKNSFNVYTDEQQKSFVRAAAEIQQLLQQLEKSYPTSTTHEKLAFAAEAIRHIDSNPKLHQRVLSALKAGGVQALGQALNHPAASFLIGALEDWQNSK